ncbi:MAG: hypothetical protein ACREBG_09785 [Pyrinomonadaceae bacterium]
MTQYLHDWIEWQENQGRLMQNRMQEILARQGKQEKYSLEDVQQAERQAMQELGLTRKA